MTCSKLSLVLLTGALALAGCVQNEPWFPTAMSTQVTGDFFPRPDVQVLVDGDVPGFTHAELTKLVVERMRNSATSGITFEAGTAPDPTAQRIAWRFAPDPAGIAVSIRLDDENQPMANSTARLPGAGAPDRAALGRAISVLTSQLYATAQYQPTRK